MVFENGTFNFSTSVALAYNGFGLGEVPPCRMLNFSTKAYWRYFAKPLL